MGIATSIATTRRARAAAAVLVAAALAGCSGGDDAGGGDAGGGDAGGGDGLRVGDAWAAQAEDVAAVYLRIDNDGDGDRLVGASTEAAGSVSVMVESATTPGGHEGMDGHVDVEVPEGTTEFSPGAGHVMLNELVAPLGPGDTVELVLEFDRAGERSVDVEVVGWEEAVERNEAG